jgi:hypothetical protein
MLILEIQSILHTYNKPKKTIMRIAFEKESVKGVLFPAPGFPPTRTRDPEPSGDHFNIFLAEQVSHE